MLNGYQYLFAANSSTLSDTVMEDVVTYHQENPAMKKRPFVTKAVLLLYQGLDLPVRSSFMIISFISFFLCFVWLNLCSTQLPGGDYRLPMILFLSNYSIIFAYTAPIYTYDDPLQYFFIFCGLYFFNNNRRFPALILLTIATLSRESTLFLLPTLFMSEISSVKRKYLLWPYLLPVLAYFIHFRYLHSAGIEDRYTHWAINFSSFREGTTSLFSMMATMMPILYFYYKQKNQLTPGLRIGFLISLTINTLVILICTKARESRLFLLPLLPLLPYLAKAEIPSIKKIHPMAFLAVFPAIGLFFAYYPTASSFLLGHRLYFALSVFLFGTLMINQRLDHSLQQRAL